MSRNRLIADFLPLLLAACFPPQPEIVLPPLPARPLVDALELRREKFVGLKALARADIITAGKKRSYDSVGIVVDGQRRLRVEVFGPLGEALATLVWDGREMQLRLEDGREVRPGAADIERLIGLAMDGRELCAALSGNIPDSEAELPAKAYREPDGGSLLVLNGVNGERRVSVQLPEPGHPQDVQIVQEELYRSGRLAYRARYEAVERVAEYLIAKTMTIESPGRHTSVTLTYSDVDINTPLPDDAFVLHAGEGVR